MKNLNYKIRNTHQKTNQIKRFKTTANGELPCVQDFYSAEIDALVEYANGWAWGSCPFHPDSNPSFTVNLVSGAFRCMSSNCGVKGNNIVSFVSQLHQLNYTDSRKFLENWK